MSMVSLLAFNKGSSSSSSIRGKIDNNMIGDVGTTIIATTTMEEIII